MYTTYSEERDLSREIDARGFDRATRAVTVIVIHKKICAIYVTYELNYD